MFLWLNLQRESLLINTSFIGFILGVGQARFKLKIGESLILANDFFCCTSVNFTENRLKGAGFAPLPRPL